jgi:hypothetical protein
MASNTQGHSAGVVSILAGVATATLIYLHPEHLLVPGWVAYSACLAFVFAGWILLAQADSGRQHFRWLVVALVGTMIVPALWAALGTSSQTCSAAIAGIVFVPSDVVCRVVWGVSAVVLFVLFIWSIRWAMVKPNAG